MRKILVILLSLMMVLSLCACGKTQNSTPVPATEAPAPATEVPVSETAAPAPVAEAPAEEAKPVETKEEVELNQDEQELITLVGEDLNVVDDGNFASVVPELIYHVGEHDGEVYMMEGIFHQHGDEIFLGRTLKNGDEVTELMFPMRYLNKEIADGSWVGVTGVINSENSATVLDIIAIEVKAEAGNAVLEWSGHHH